MRERYNYYDFEQAYFKYQYLDCIKIGLYLLSKLKDKTSLKFRAKLQKAAFSWNTSQKERYLFGKLLEEVKIWLYVHANF